MNRVKKGTEFKKPLTYRSQRGIAFLLKKGLVIFALCPTGLSITDS